jgi:ATP-dependent exoDNAse (exonuclease V) beta subunit
VLPAPPRPRPAPQRLSYSSLQSYAKCGYRFYLQRILGLPAEPPPVPVPVDAAPAAAPGLEGRVRGTLAHLLLEELDFAQPAAPEAAVVATLAAEQGVELTPADVQDLRGLVLAVAASPLRVRLAEARRVRREAPFAFTTEPEGGGQLVHGFLDVLAEEADGTVLVVDYKSDRLDGRDPAEVVEQDYATQRLVYALAALRHGAPRAEVAYIFLERPEEPVTRTFDRDDAAELGDRLLELARGVLDERWPVAEHPHRELCGDCPGRRALCSWPESMTLRARREDADAQSPAGSLGGSTGPS